MIIFLSNIEAEQIEHASRVFSERDIAHRKVYFFPMERYRRWHGGGKLQRLALRAAFLGLYPFKAAWVALTAPGGSTFVVTSNTFFVPLLVAWVGKLRGQRTFELLFDLYPDAIEVYDPSQRGGWLSRLIGWVTRQTQKHCDGVVYLGDVLRQHAEARYGPAKRSSVIEVIADAKLFEKPKEEGRAVSPRPPSVRDEVTQETVGGDREMVDCSEEAIALRSGASSPLRIRYGGQLGHMHHAELLARCVAAGAEELKAVAFDFFVSGAGVPKARPILEAAGIKLQAPSFDPDWRARMSECPISLVALSPGGATVCFPSKTFASLAAGQAILAICPRWSDLGRMIEKHELGWVVDNSSEAQHETHAETPRRKDLSSEAATALRHDYSVPIQEGIGVDPESLRLRPESVIVELFVVTLKLITENPEELLRRRQNAWNLAHHHYTDDWLAERWLSSLREEFVIANS